MKQREFEYITYTESERLARLENRAAELERRLGEVTPAHGAPESRAQDLGSVEFAVLPEPPHGGAAYAGVSRGRHAAGYPAVAYADSGHPAHAAAAGYPEAVGAERDDLAGYREPGTGLPEEGTRFWPAAGAGYRDGEYGGYPEPGPGGPDERTEVLINRGRRNTRRRGPGSWLAHWRAIAIGLAAVLVGAVVLAMALPGGAGWPASVARVQRQIEVACQNPNVVSEPSQVNFACAKDTRQILWVFSLLTSGNDPNFSDPSNGRKGLEPITPAQGGDVAWSLNLHHPYDPASPTDSLAVAARAINDIIGGASVTNSKGAPVVQPGLESSAANCARYTGSPALVTRQGFPALCALPVTSPDGRAALVSDVFSEWMVGTPAQAAAEAGTLFRNADNPGDPRVQSILNSLQISGL